MIKEYLDKIANTTAQGDAREESYYGHFSAFLADFAESIGKTKIQITTLPKKTEAGNPDFRIWDGSQHIIGYIEAKKPGENLEFIEDSEQLKRYRSTFPNLILTDFYEFRLYRNGQLIDSVSIGRSFLAKKLKMAPPLENQEKFITLLEKFFGFSLPKVFTAENLAVELAKRTGFLRDEVITKELEEEEKSKGNIYGFYQAFKQYLVANLTQNDFADIYAQTITYGLFAARTRANAEFNRKMAYELIPPTIGILKEVFQFISLGKIPPHMEVIVDDIAEVLQVADVNKILHEYYRKGKGEDPIIHFYETFLNIYDPTTREKRGVYYTPEPVVKYIVRSIHVILKSHFNLNDGLASKEITLLDPAGGTLTFPAEAIKLAVEEFTGKYGEGGKQKFIKNQMLKNFYAFELMMAPYAIGHIKISFLLEKLGYQLQEDDRFKLYLTNTLDMEDLKQTEIPGLGSLSEESYLAAMVKKNEPILVILGNPPYSGISANINKWTEKLLKENIDGAQSYYEVDGKPLGERKLWLQDDYVKFLRFAQWKIHKAGQGIVGMITNHSYLDNPTFRGMRQSLLNTFNEIYILDLHGNALKKETAPDGSKDENVFDIRQGVCIALFVKQKNTCAERNRGKKENKIYHTDVFGMRKDKYKWLEKHDFKPRIYKSITPKTPWYFFIPKDTRGIEQYNNWPKVNEIFPVNNVGIVTARDHFAIDINKHTLENRIRQYRDKRYDDDMIRTMYILKDTSTFKLKKYRTEFQKLKDWEQFILPIQYRPFDKRFIYYSKWIVERPIYDSMKHMIKIDNNKCLITIRRSRNKDKWNFALISDIIVAGSTTITSLDMNYVYPLYVLPENDNGGNGDLFNAPKFEPQPNINETIYETLKENYSNRLKLEQIFSYVYAVLYSNSYREKYVELLKIDFPRIPFTTNYSLFQQLAKLGDKLIELHLLKHSALIKPIAKYNGKGDDDKIKKPAYNEKERRVYINENKYFENIAPEIWNYHIGGYQVMEKYLKDRKGRQMDNSEHYCKMVTSIAETLIIQKKIDTIFSKVEKNTISLL
ncbi:MAG: N-6 DNA methylase [Bacteroidia bacterium]|nr:N-6 DNA methylase [Bacteroidia bacterium]